MITYFYVYMFWYSHTSMITCYDNHMLLCLHALTRTCPFAYMPWCSYAWTLLWLDAPMLTCFVDHMYLSSHFTMITCFHVYMLWWSHTHLLYDFELICLDALMITYSYFEMFQWLMLIWIDILMYDIHIHVHTLR